MSPFDFLREAEDERHPHEPAEAQLGPGSPDDESMFGPSGTDPAIIVGFWSLVILFNIGLFGLTVGPMLIYFRGDWSLGGALLGLGALATIHGLYKYRSLRQREDLWDD